MPDEQRPQIEMRKVTKAFGDNVVLDELDLDIPANNRVCMIGPSGSGKSTILRLLMTLEAPTSGRIAIDGELLWPEENPEKMGREARQRQDRLRLRVGMVFQHFNLFPHLKVRENVTLGPRLVRGEATAEANDKAVELLDHVGLREKSEQYPGELSGGQKQRVAIARALAMEPDIMLFDEATSALDPELVGEVLGVIEDLAARGDMTMCFVTHQLHFVERFAHRVVVLDGGKIVEDGDPKVVLKDPQHERTKSFLTALDMA